jgi:hypothetical protein
MKKSQELRTSHFSGRSTAGELIVVVDERRHLGAGRMKQELIVLTAFSVILALSSGCGRTNVSGGGTGGITAGTTKKTVNYGWSGADGKLGFVIFTDLDSPDTIGTASATWTGCVESPTGPTVHYKRTSGGMDIDGTEYEFAKGRVFLVSTKEGRISVNQLDIPIGDARYEAEIDRIKELAEVQEFLSK